MSVPAGNEEPESSSIRSDASSEDASRRQLSLPDVPVSYWGETRREPTGLPAKSVRFHVAPRSIL
jgi:hypothetical protein